MARYHQAAIADQGRSHHAANDDELSGGQLLGRKFHHRVVDDEPRGRGEHGCDAAQIVRHAVPAVRLDRTRRLSRMKVARPAHNDNDDAQDGESIGNLAPADMPITIAHRIVA